MEARVPYVTDGDGMHTFTDPADDATYVAAYAGMDLAQKVFACFDQPDLKAPCRPLRDRPRRLDGARQRPAARRTTATPGRFATTPPISTYLFVVCAGPWHSRTWEHAGLPFGWHARASLAAELDRDFDDLREVTEACFDHYTAALRRALPVRLLRPGVRPGPNWGALETPGCVTFRDEYLPRSEPDAGELVDRATVIAHEMAHMWFGDLVTMSWWEDTWLNESFADYMGYQVPHEAGVLGLVARLLAEPQAHRRTPPTSAARPTRSPRTPSTWSTSTPRSPTSTRSPTPRATSVLRQLVTWLGWDTFLAGANPYLTPHRFGNAELADFLAALDAATDRDVRGWAEAWLRTTGFDTLRVTRDGDVPVLDARGLPAAPRSASPPLDGELRGASSRLVDLGADPVALRRLRRCCRAAQRRRRGVRRGAARRPLVAGGRRRACRRSPTR